MLFHFCLVMVAFDKSYTSPALFFPPKCDLWLRGCETFLSLSFKVYSFTRLCLWIFWYIFSYTWWGKCWSFYLWTSYWNIILNISAFMLVCLFFSFKGFQLYPCILFLLFFFFWFSFLMLFFKTSYLQLSYGYPVTKSAFLKTFYLFSSISVLFISSCFMSILLLIIDILI